MLRRRRRKLIFAGLTGSNVRTQEELDTCILNSLAAMNTENLLRTRMSPSEAGFTNLMSLDFTKG